MIKTNIKMRATPEQSRKIQEICFENGIRWVGTRDCKILEFAVLLLIKEDTLAYSLFEQVFNNQDLCEIDADLFIRTNGTCIEDNKANNQKPIQYQIGIDTFERSKANMSKDELIACAKFNIDKYNWRKKGQDIEDFEKIIDYANFAIEVLKENR